MSAIAKVVLVGTPVAVGLFAAIFGGKRRTRPPWEQPIPVPGQGVAWEAVDEATCLCWEAGERERAPLTQCVLGRLWPDVPWPAQRRDHATVQLTQRLVGERVAAFLAAVAAGQDPCAAPVEPGIVIPAEPVEPDVPDVPDVPPEPDVPVGPDPADPLTWLADDGRPASYRRVRQGDNPTLVARSVFDFGVGDARTVAVLKCIAACGWNLYLYSRTRDPGSYGAVKIGTKWYDVGPAYLPRNDDAVAAFAASRMPVRTINRKGERVEPGSSYGTLWIPDMTMAQGSIVCPGDIWSPERNPPQPVLDRFGVSLEQMRATWEAQAA